MSSFELAWLELREPADHAARDGRLLGQAADHLDGAARPFAIDLGAGTGSTLRAMTPMLARRARWRLVDSDAKLLGEAARGAPDQAVETVVADLSDPEALDFDGATLVCASALLDLTSEAWIGRLTGAVARASAGFYAALNYDGRMSWAKPHPLDAAATAAFNQHQRRDKGFGPALGPDAARAAERRLEALGFAVETADSPWRLGRDEAGLECELVRGIANAVRETGALSAADLAGWREARTAGAGRSGCVVGHLDLLALPRR